MRRVYGPTTQTPLAHVKLKPVGLALLLCCLIPGIISAQCVDCSLADINPDPTPDLMVECEGDIAPPEDYLIINPACPAGTITFADVTVVAGTGANGSPHTFDRTYTYDSGTGIIENCTQRIIQEASADAFAFTSCPGDMTFNLDAGACEKYVSFLVEATGECVEIVQTSGIASGEAFPIGTTMQEFVATDLSGAMMTCAFNITVVEYSGPVSNLACQADVNVTVDENCMAIITPNLVLNGNFLCEDNYTVTVSGLTPASAISGNGTSEVLIDAGLLDGFIENGMVGPFDVMVSDGVGSCWNEGWMLEDKSPPEICCTDFSVSCVGAADPDNIIFGNRVWDATALPQAIPDPAGSSPFGVLEIPVEVDACENILLSGISVFLGIEHEQVGDLTVQVISPSGTTGLIFDRPGFPATATGCTGIDIANWFGASPNLHSVLEDDCMVDFGSGESSSIESASPINTIFNGEPIGGTWIVRILDLNQNGITGTAENIRLSLSGNYGEPLLTENCADIEPTYTDVFSTEGCAPFQTITRTWIAADAKGADTCVQTITVQRVSIRSVTCPENFDNIDNPALACNGNFATDINGHPSPTVTGEPTIGGFSVDNFCMFDRLYTDLVFPSCGEAYDIQRTWTIIDWCSGEDTICVQNIKIMDQEPPTLVCPADMNLDAGLNCALGVTLPAPATLTDNCSSTGPTYTVSATQGTLSTSGGSNILADLPLGTTTVTYTASDDCGNTATCDFDITIADNTPPPCVGQSFTEVFISGSGSTVPWTTFVDPDDLENLDNCTTVTAEVRRLDMDHCEGDDSSLFDDEVPFYCCDVSQVVTVEIKLTDAAGNENVCTVSANVHDNIAPSISCPVDKEISCDGYEALLAVYDGVTVDGDGVPDASATDPLAYAVVPDFAGTGDTSVFIGYYPAASDNCDVTVTISTGDFQVDQCGNSLNAAGTAQAAIKRTYTATDGSGNTSACIQMIGIVNPDPFDPNTDILWPDAEVTVDCSESAAVGEPVLTETDGCDEAHFYMVDQGPISTDDTTICYKVLRTWFVLDKCTSLTVPVASFTQTIKVADDQSPTLTCFPAQSVDVGNTFDASATVTDNCTAGIVLDYAIDLGNDGGVADFTGTGSLGVVTAGSAMFPIGTHAVTYTASDDCGNTSTCSVVVTINDNLPPLGAVSGAIGNEEAAMMNNVEVSPGLGMDVALTDDNGEFNMNLPTLENYEITPQKDDDHLNGVSTYDIVLISKHILNIEALNSPYKMIAADINKSGDISTLDMVLLRKLILFINTDFENNTSWRFVDAGYVFNNPSNPFNESFPESYPINGLNSDMEGLDFVAVKIGDVNCTATVNGLLGNAEGRTFEGDLKLRIKDEVLEANETYFIDVKAKDFNEVLGYQFTMGFDEDMVEVLNIEAAELPGLNDNNFNLQSASKGVITTSWNQQVATSLDDNTVLFTMEVRAKQAIAISEVFNVSSRFTAAEAYQEDAASINLLNVAFEYEDAAGEVQEATAFELYQNRPNPFKNETLISFRLPEGGQASLKIYDLSGKVVKWIKGDFEKGYNELSLDRSELGASGVLYYELSTTAHTAIQKMIVID